MDMVMSIGLLQNRQYKLKANYYTLVTIQVPRHHVLPSKCIRTCRCMYVCMVTIQVPRHHVLPSKCIRTCTCMYVWLVTIQVPRHRVLPSKCMCTCTCMYVWLVTIHVPRHHFLPSKYMRTCMHVCTMSILTAHFLIIMASARIWHIRIVGYFPYAAM
jgi:hypothetical protein